MRGHHFFQMSLKQCADSCQKKALMSQSWEDTQRPGSTSKVMCSKHSRSACLGCFWGAHEQGYPIACPGWPCSNPEAHPLISRPASSPWGHSPSNASSFLKWPSFTLHQIGTLSPSLISTDLLEHNSPAPSLLTKTISCKSITRLSLLYLFCGTSQAFRLFI